MRIIYSILFLIFMVGYLSSQNDTTKTSIEELIIKIREKEKNKEKSTSKSSDSGKKSNPISLSDSIIIEGLEKQLFLVYDESDKPTKSIRDKTIESDSLNLYIGVGIGFSVIVDAKIINDGKQQIDDQNAKNKNSKKSKSKDTCLNSNNIIVENYKTNKIYKSKKNVIYSKDILCTSDFDIKSKISFAECSAVGVFLVAYISDLKNYDIDVSIFRGTVDDLVALDNIKQRGLVFQINNESGNISYSMVGFLNKVDKVLQFSKITSNHLNSISNKIK